MTQMVVPITELMNRCITILQSWGYSEEESRAIAENLVEAELVKRPTHGIARLVLMKQSLDTGDIRLTHEVPTVLRESANVLFIDGHRRSGFYVMTYALNRALDKAKDSDVVVVGITNTGPSTGLLGLYARKATAEDKIFIGMSNCEGGLVPYGLKEPIWGTNPFTVGIPTTTHPIIFDIASSLINWGNVYLAGLKGEQIPLGVAIDTDGKITSDPYKASGMLPFADHKGSGLAMVIELLAGALTGSRVGYAVPGGWGILFIILDPTVFRPLVEFKNDIMMCIEELKMSQKAENVHQVFFPGEHSAERRAASISQGVVEVDASIYYSIFKSVEIDNGMREPLGVQTNPKPNNYAMSRRGSITYS